MNWIEFKSRGQKLVQSDQNMWVEYPTPSILIQPSYVFLWVWNIVETIHKTCSISLLNVGVMHLESSYMCKICSKVPFILRRHCVALPCCTFLHRNCDVTVLRSRMKVEFIITWNEVLVRWLATESNSYIGTATQRNVSKNGPLFGRLDINTFRDHAQGGCPFLNYFFFDIPCLVWNYHILKGTSYQKVEFSKTTILSSPT